MKNNPAAQTGQKSFLKIGVLIAVLIIPAYYVAAAYTPIAGAMLNSAQSGKTLNEVWTNQQIHQDGAPPIQNHSVIVILAELSDVPYSKTRSQINSTVFTDMRSYYEEVSYDKMTITGNTTDWVHLSNTTIQYGSDDYSWWLVRDVVKNVDTYVNFADYDKVVVVHSGNDQASSHSPNDIWSATWSGIWLQTNDGVVIQEASIVAESDPAGIFAHEFGHLLGLPDLYKSSPDTYVGPWDLMATGAWLPSQMTSWSRIALGWISANSTLVGRMLIGILDPLEIQGTNFTAIKIPITTKTYYLVEDRQRDFPYDVNLPSNGTLILYCDETRESGQGIVQVQHPNRTLSQAPFTVSPSSNKLLDYSNNINITILAQYSQSFRVSISLISQDNTPPKIDISSAIQFLWPTSMPATIQVSITDVGSSSSAVKNATLVYSSDSGKTWLRTAMTPIGDDDIYSAVIPPQHSSSVEYYIEAYDYAGNLAVANNGGGNYIYFDLTLALVIASPIITVIAIACIIIVRRMRKSRLEEVKVVEVKPLSFSNYWGLGRRSPARHILNSTRTVAARDELK